MRALTISEHGGLDRIELRDDLPVPVPSAPHDVQVRVLAAALNRLDLFVVEGLPGVTIRPPWILGADAVGEVTAIGGLVSTVSVGDRVIVNPGISDRSCEYCRAGEQSLCLRYGILGEHHPGTLAEFVVVPEFNLRSVAESVPLEAAAAFTLVTLTAWKMLAVRGALRRGEDVLIQGIGGGVSQAAFAIARELGANVWVTSTSDAKLERALEMGAVHAINSSRDDVGKVIRERSGKRGVNVVVDSVGAMTWRSSLQALGKGGRLVTCGATSGPVVQMDLRRVFWNHQSILASTMGSESDFDAVTAHLREGRLLPVVDSVYSLADGRAPFDRLAGREHFGKVVVRVGS